MRSLVSRAPLTGSRRELILIAAREASKIRLKSGLSPVAQVCAFDIAATLGVEVRFTNDIASMEGVYLKDPPQILVSSLRPAGRQSFTLAHELGHHVFGHEGHILQNPGDQDEQQAAQRFNPDEVLADAFAALNAAWQTLREYASAARRFQRHGPDG